MNNLLNANQIIKFIMQLKLPTARPLTTLSIVMLIRPITILERFCVRPPPLLLLSQLPQIARTQTITIPKYQARFVHQLSLQ
jgi:hypothetical protein